jgi:phage terminase large subunit-like protein
MPKKKNPRTMESARKEWARKNHSTKPMTQKQIDAIQMLRAHGCTFKQISENLGIGYGTCQKYGAKVTFLPKSQRKNPFELLSPKKNPKEYEKRVPRPQDYIDIADKDHWRENYIIGTRYEGPLDIFSLTEFQELMEEPTDYHSNLNMKEWAIKYGEGPKNFLKYTPYKWGKGQLEIFDLWDKHRKVMIETHRDYGKTMAVDIIIAREMCENRENNYAIVSETDKKARARVKHIGDFLLKCKLLIADYGFLPHQKIYKGTRQSWTKGEITIKRDIAQTDPSLMCFSSTSKGATGAHFNGIVYDDVWSRILDRNPDNKEKWLEWFDGELEGCLEDAWELWALTRKGVTDLYQTMEDRQYYVIYKRPAVLKFPSKYHYQYKTVEGIKVFDKVIVESKDWVLSDPSRFTIEFFLEKKMKMNPAEWESEYQLNPTARTGKYWKWKDLRFIEGYKEFNSMVDSKGSRRRSKIIGSMDLAFGTSARADYTALTIIGYYEQKYYFLELYLKRGASENDLVKILGEAKRTFPRLETIYIEADLQQTARVESLKQKAGFLHILPVFSRQEQSALDKANKERKSVNLTGKPLRIWSQLEANIEDNKLYINKHIRNFKEFKAEFITFPKCEHFDVLDALGMGVSKMKKKGVLLYALHSL